MRLKYHLFIGIALTSLLGLPAFVTAQEDSSPVTLSGSLQSDMLFPQVDEQIGTGTYDADFLSHTFLDLTLQSKYVTAGARLELLNNPLPGFEQGYAGAGIPHFYVTGKYKFFEVTAGDIYDQFGNGFIFRAYEDRPLGIDNALRGGRIVLMPYDGIRFKVLGGMQRIYWNFNSSNGYGFNYAEGGAVWGADLELQIDDWVPTMQENNWRLMLGGSFVSRFEPEQDIFINPLERLNLPLNVGAGDVRVHLNKDNFSFMAEYAYKANDPSADNDFIYKPGQAVMVSASYSQRGMSFLLQAKRSENMAFRSQRTMMGTAGFINHLPAFTMTHTYALAAFYPYATQPQGEWAFQGEARYTFKRKTPMGGKYGTSFRLNASYVTGIQQDFLPGNIMGTDGYSTHFFEFGDETYYTDINLEMNKKLTKNFSMTAMYMYQIYNQKIVEGKGHNGDLVKSNIGIVELKYTANKNVAMRGEVQYLYTQQDQGSWGYIMYELALYKSLMLEISDLYNFGETKIHYYKVGATYNYKSHRLQLAYGKTRAGYNCSGGVCRYVPASKGLSISYNVNF